MNILVINGSPKGKNSITYQTALYLKKKFPEYTYEVLHAGQRIHALEKDFTEAIEKIQQADLIIFSYPVYTFIAPSQLHRFIELMKEMQNTSKLDLKGKYVTQITTSKHFYDVTAHRYIQENCQDMGMKFIRGLSADMEDLLKKKGQKEAREFFRYVCWCMNHDHYEPYVGEDAVQINEIQINRYQMNREQIDQIQIERARMNQERGENASVPKKRRELPPAVASLKPVVIVTDCEKENERLRTMIDRFCKILPLPTKIVNIREYPFTGGCLGCFHCAISGKCIYKDKFDEFLRNDIQAGSAIVYAFTIRDHSMGSVFKMYDDRQFCNGHRSVTMGIPMGYLVSGDYHREENLRMILEGRAEVGGNFLAGVATDEQNTDANIDRMAKTLTYAIRHHYQQPKNFLGVGGMKIFRDLIWQMQGMMRADHKFFKEHGQYDFPQKKKGTIVGMYLVGMLLASPKVQKKIGNKMTEGMLMPYKKIVE